MNAESRPGKRALIPLGGTPCSPVSGLAQGSPGASAPPQRTATPPWERGDEYLYGRFFTHVVAIGKQADEAQAQGMNPAYLRNYFQTTAQLNNSQAILLTAIAADLDVHLKQYDARAAELQQQHHIEFQKKRLKHEPAPPPPLELLGLKQGRDALILQARDRLRQNLGDAEFRHLDDYLRAQLVRQRSSGSPAPAATQNTEKPPAAVLDRVIYRAMFRTVASFKARAQQERDWGLPELSDDLLTAVQRAAALSSEQARILDSVASEYLQACAASEQQLRKAMLVRRKLTLDMLARDAKITQTPELAAATAPVSQVRQQMDVLADNAISQLQTAFGAEAFARFDAFVKQPKKKVPPKVAAGLHPASPEVSR